MNCFDVIGTVDGTVYTSTEAQSGLLLYLWLTVV